MRDFDPADLIDDVCVVIVAAGSGERLAAARPKAFVGLGGRVLLAHSLAAFEAHEAVDSIVLVVPEGWEGPTEVLVDDLGCERVSSIETGGSSRAASVRAGLAGVPDRRATAVLVHDAARPVVPADLIDRVLAPLAEGYDVVVPALPIADTVKQVDPATGQTRATLQRQELRLAQTPQASRASSLHAAMRDLDDAQLELLSDCSAAIERCGGRALCVEGDARCTKVTTPEDLQALERRLFPQARSPEDGGDELPAGDAHPHDSDPLDEDDLVGLHEEESR